MSASNESGGGTTWIGRAVDRVDGRLKVTGGATYAADYVPAQPPLVGWIVEAKTGRGRIVAVETGEAEAVEGVVTVLTHANAPEQMPYGEPEDADRFTQSHALLEDDEVRYYGQPVALVVAETLEIARGAAELVAVTYEGAEGRFEVRGDEPDEVLTKPDELDGGADPDVDSGDFEAVWASCDVKVDATYTTAGQHANPMEPHATLAEWDGARLTVRTSIQIVGSAVEALANTLKLEPDAVRVVSPFIGGGFGSKLGIHADAVLASLAAMETGRPVRVVQTRRNMFASAPHRGNSRQRVRLGATPDGRLRAVAHESVMPMTKGYPFAEPCAAAARVAYGCEGLRTRHRVVRVDMPAIDSMRAPGEAIGSLAFESAVDELARALGQDPVDVRLRNVAEEAPGSGKPFVKNDLRRCLEVGSARYGWRERARGGERDGRWLVGHGVAGSTRPNMMMEASARVRLDDAGRATAELDMTDIGTGSYTILAQIVAETLELPLDAVTVSLGDSRFPKTAGSGGSFGAASAGGALLKACEKLREQLANGGERCAEASVEPGDAHDEYAQHMYGAHFVEAGVDAVTGEVRLRRIVGAFSFGRVLNPKTARSQLLGAIVFGIGGALTEELMLDPRSGCFMNRDLAGYHLPVNRDVPPIDVVMLGEADERYGPLGSKGVGELGICGLGAAIANAVFDATGVRVRDFPITLDKILPGLPPLA